MLKKEDRIFIAGAHGMVGSALFRFLKKKNYQTILAPSRKELDYLDQRATHQYLAEQKPDCVVVAAAKVGGIAANVAEPAAFLYENLMIASNLIEGAHRAGIDRLLYLGSSCIYPKEAPQPLRENSLFCGALEPTNAPYAIAKLAGIALCQAYRKEHGHSYISALPTNLYGPGDSQDLEKSHVLPALLQRFVAASKRGSSHVEVWGSGTPLREFLHVDDLASALHLLLSTYDEADPVNIGGEKEVSIADLAQLIAELTGFRGQIIYNPTRPDGMMRKRMDSTKIYEMGWRPTLSLREGIKGLLLEER